MYLRQFHPVDYTVCLLVLVISLGIGLFYARKGQKSTKNYFMGNKMNLIPVATSMAVTYLSAITMLGFPAELYYFGITYWLLIVGRIIGFAITAYVYVPWLYPLKITSANQYLQMRFGSRALVVYGSLLQIITVIVVSGAVLYGPAILFEAVSVIPTWACMLLSGVASTVYTTLGGFEGVIATDVFQATIMIGGLMAVLISGLVNAGGSGRVWQLYKEGGRLRLDSFLNPLAHGDVFSMIVCTAILNANSCGVNQAGFQRLCSMPTMQQAKRMFLLAIPPMAMMSSIACLTGIIAYAYYAGIGCDPLAAGYIRSPNAIIPYLVMEILGYPGLPGLFISACLCGALSNLSSSLNASALLVWEDFISLRAAHFTEEKKTRLIKIIAACLGLVSIGFGFLAMNLPGTIIQVTMSLVAATSTPLSLIFLIGGLYPRANWKNAMVTSITVLAVMFSIVIGGAIIPHKSQMLPLTTENCLVSPNGNITILTMFNETVMAEEEEFIGGSYNRIWSENKTVISGMAEKTYEVTGFLRLFAINGLWYAVIGFTLGAMMTIILSFIPGFHNTETVNPSLLLTNIWATTQLDEKEPGELLQQNINYELVEKTQDDIIISNGTNRDIHVNEGDVWIKKDNNFQI